MPDQTGRRPPPPERRWPSFRPRSLRSAHSNRCPVRNQGGPTIAEPAGQKHANRCSSSACGSSAWRPGSQITHVLPGRRDQTGPTSASLCGRSWPSCPKAWASARRRAASGRGQPVFQSPPSKRAERPARWAPPGSLTATRAHEGHDRSHGYPADIAAGREDDWDRAGAPIRHLSGPLARRMCRCHQPVDIGAEPAAVIAFVSPVDASDDLTIAGLTHVRCSRSEVRSTSPAQAEQVAEYAKETATDTDVISRPSSLTRGHDALDQDYGAGRPARHPGSARACVDHQIKPIQGLRTTHRGVLSDPPSAGCCRGVYCQAICDCSTATLLPDPRVLCCEVRKIHRETGIASEPVAHPGQACGSQGFGQSVDRVGMEGRDLRVAGQRQDDLLLSR